MSAVLREGRAPFVLNDSARMAIAAFLACSFALPIRLFQVGEFEVPLAIMIVLCGLPTLFSLFRISDGPLLVASAAAGVISVCLWDLSSASSNSFHPYLSFVYYFLPYVGYGAGFYLIRSGRELERLLSVAAVASAITGMGIVVTLAASGLPVRAEGDLLGSLLGLPLYATHGVNTLAITEFMLFAFIWTDVFFGGSAPTWIRFFELLGMICLGGLIFLSLSRGAVASLAAFLVLGLIAVAARRPITALLIFAGIAGLSGFVAVRYSEQISLAWGLKFSQSSSSLANGEANELTSGRLTLVNAALADVEENPLLGVGFTGFHAATSTFSEEDALNSSPHNQYLTMVWKSGLISGGILFAFLVRRSLAIRRLRRLRTAGQTAVGLWCLVVSILVVACFTWDVLLVPNIGAMIVFLFGAAASVEARATAGRQP